MLTGSSLRRLLPIMTCVVFSLAMAWMGRATITSGQTQAKNWYKGNTHTHTLLSDGDSSPEDVTRWYRDHGYNFLVLTDHNVLDISVISALNAAYAVPESFMLIRGEEVTDGFQGKPVHLSALGLDRALPLGQGGTSVANVLQRNVTAIRDANGLPSINHPNFQWALTANDMLQVAGYNLFEVYNGHPGANNLGGSEGPSVEAIWDTILSSGRLIYGLALDDAHHFKSIGPSGANPGRGWIHVRAPSLDSSAILNAIAQGDFYGSTGVELSDYQVSSAAMALTIKESVDLTEFTRI